jgi:hypothetical protein
MKVSKMNLSNETVKSMMSFIDEQIAFGNYEKNSPRYQVHLIEEPLFFPILDELLKGAKSFFNDPVVIMFWAYVEYSSSYSFYEKRGIWHHHDNCITALFYLNNPEIIGTEFPDGSFFYPQPHEWLYMDGYEYHRPPIPKTESRRYTLAANIIEKDRAISVLGLTPVSDNYE